MRRPKITSVTLVVVMAAVLCVPATTFAMSDRDASKLLEHQMLERPTGTAPAATPGPASQTGGTATGSIPPAALDPSGDHSAPEQGTAEPGDPESSNTATQVVNAGKRALLRQRIAESLERRKVRFDAAVAEVLDGIDGATTVADGISSAGGDTSAVRTELDRATRRLADARSAEASAAAQFKAVPSAANRRSAFNAAGAQARLAVRLLSNSRISVRNAILDLRAIANGLRGVTP